MLKWRTIRTPFLESSLLPFELLFALLLPGLAFLLILRSLPLELDLTLCGFLLRLGFLRREHRRHGMSGCFGCGLRVTHRAMLVRANGQLATKLLAVDHYCGLGGGARHYRLRVGDVDHIRNLPNVTVLDCFPSLLLGVALAVLGRNRVELGRKEKLNR